MKNSYVKKASDLVTSKEETRAGFINFALEKNRKSTPYIEQAKVFKLEASKAKEPKELLENKAIESSLLSAAGLSDKSLKYFGEDDKKEAIKKLIENFLEPAGKYFVDEVVYRYLLIKGDSLGGSMRNFVGAFAQQKLVRFFLASLSVRGVEYRWLKNSSRNKWVDKPTDETLVESDVRALSWEIKGRTYTLAFNLTIPIVKKNIDICLFDTDEDDYDLGKVVKDSNRIIMLGELKGGIDPAGADEHWKTANTALNRIREAFGGHENIRTSFVGAAIENAMSEEIFDQYNKNILTNVANLSNENQLIDYCGWLVDVKNN